MNLSPHTRALVGGIIWVLVGVFLIARGLFPYGASALESAPAAAILWLVGGLLAGTAKGLFVLTRSAARMIGRIEARPHPAPFWQIYPPLFFLLIPIMIGFGILLRLLFGDSHPEVVAGVYVGIGAALIASSAPFFRASQRLARAHPSTPHSPI